MSVEPTQPDLAIQVAQAFAAFGPAYKRWIQASLDPDGVSFARLRLLGAIHHNGPLIMSGLSEEIGVSPRNVTSLVDGLEAEGLVRRVPHPTDRRATLIELTSAGAGYGCRMASGEHLGTIAGLFRELTPADQQALLRLIGLLREGLARRGYGGGTPGG